MTFYFILFFKYLKKYENIENCNKYKKNNIVFNDHIMCKKQNF